MAFLKNETLDGNKISGFDDSIDDALVRMSDDRRDAFVR